jgi:predicted aldo/keto reductase-like oxidoreductase
MAQVTRRGFLKTGMAATMLGGIGGVFPARAAKRLASDWVTLGRSGVQVTRLAFGTGTHGGSVQRNLGQEGFTRLVRYAYDNGIRFFETADTYHAMPQMLATALKGIPRDTYRLMTKYNPAKPDDPKTTIDTYRQELGTEYVDILLIHKVNTPNWPEETKRLQDAFAEAKQNKIIMAHGASVHGLQPLRAFPGNRWLDVGMIRMNHNGTRMDLPTTFESNDLGDVNEVTAHVQKVRSQGIGVISMKLIGEGRFTNPEDRQAALNHAMQVAQVDAVTIGFKNTAEIDEAIERMNRALEV